MAKATKPAETRTVRRAAKPATQVQAVVVDGAEMAQQQQLARAFTRQIVFWSLTFAVLVLFLFMFSAILLPFAAGLILAYFLDPVADYIERWTGSRLLAATIILLTFIFVLVVGLVIIIPALATQAGDLFERIPEYIERLQVLITGIDPGWLKDRFGIDTTELRDALNSVVGQGARIATSVVQSILTSGLAIVNVAGLAVITPVVAFYMLLDWDRMIATIDSWVPRNHVDTVRQLANDINAATAGFVRGQVSVCLILGIAYAIALTIAGLNFGLVIGLFAGLIGFIPYFGSLVGLLLSLSVAVVQFWPDYTMVALIAGIFFAGQFVEGNILQPKLVGSSVGLHPVWLMFALLAFGSLFGFVGLLIAVPAAAAVAVLLRFALSRYLQSPLYTGEHPPPAA